MSNLFLTLVVAFVIIVFAIALLAIGWLIKGKTRIEKASGRDLTQEQEGSCQNSELCDDYPEETSLHPIKHQKNIPPSLS